MANDGTVTDGRGREGLRVWRRAQLASQWPHLLTALLLGVALPIAAGYPRPDQLVGGDGSELAVVIVMLAGVTGLFLALAALTGRRTRELILAGVAFGVAAVHPTVDFVFGAVGDKPWSLGRTGLAGFVLAVVAAVGAGDSRAGVTVRNLAITTAALGIACHLAADVTDGAALYPAGGLLVAVAAVTAGILAHVRAVREVDGGLLAIAVLTTSAGLGSVLNLVGGQTRLTAGVAILASVSVALAAIAAAMAFLDALERHDLGRDAQRLARSLELARLHAESRRHAELAHDQRTSLLAIEAAALRLRHEPSDGLFAAVAAEAARLQRMLAGNSTDRAMFDVREVVTPVVTCLTSLHGEMTLSFDGPTEAWGHIDETAEILRSLISNAHDHGRAPVTVEVIGTADSVRIRVSDAGTGVPRALRDVIFDRGVTSDPESHSGLGLYAARRLARDNGADLRMADGDITTFELLLPAKPPTGLRSDVDIDLTDAPIPEVRSIHG